MSVTTDKVTEAPSPAGQVSPTVDAGKAVSGARPGFLDWVTRLVHTHRERLYRLAPGARDCEKKMPSTAFKTHSTHSSCCPRRDSWSNRTMIPSSCCRLW